MCTSAKTVKISPAGNSISKNLLTPCRRIGLSRKRKTPNSVLNISSKDISSSNDYLLETTPVNHNKSVKRKNRSTDFQITPLLETHLPSNTKLKKEMHTSTEELEYADVTLKRSSKRDLFQTFSSDDMFHSNDLSFVKTINEESLTSKENDKTLHVQESSLNLSNELPLDEVMTSTCFTVNCDSPQRNNFPKFISQLASSNDSLEIPDLYVNNEAKTQKTSKSNSKCGLMEVSDSDEDFKMCDNQKQSQQKLERNYTKRNETKNSLPTVVNETDVKTSDDLKVCKVQLQRLAVPDAKKKVLGDKNLKKSFEDAILDDEDDVFTSTPEQEKSKKKNLLQKIKVLEIEVNQTRKYLTNLKQAAIYKSKHNTGSINQLTSTWISGCVIGLKDLLRQLQAHGPIDMATLLNNLQIPSEIVSKLSLNE